MVCASLQPAGSIPNWCGEYHSRLEGTATIDGVEITDRDHESSTDESSTDESSTDESSTDELPTDELATHADST